MALSARDRVRYARHLLLSQLGEAGQERLFAATVHPRGDADPGVLAVARCYLQRAGVQVFVHDSLREQGTSSEELVLATTADVTRIAGSGALEEATRALLGALAAVRVIEALAALPTSPCLPQSFTLSSEEA